MWALNRYIKMKNESIKSTQIIAVFLAEVVCDFFSIRLGSNHLAVLSWAAIIEALRNVGASFP